jgi:8-oxo-dGTP pyrophosphatase MutT (NUDIX family)
MLKKEITNILARSLCDSKHTHNQFLKRLEKSMYTRDENPENHFCAYFLPFNPKNKEVFIIYHKKAGLWIAPGGHIDKGENLLQTLNRELNEELGLINYFHEPQTPFLFTITPIENRVQPCKTHYDIWYLVHTDGGKFKIDAAEFLDTKWMAIEDAKKIVIDPANITALKIVSGK